jgi:hypothetical protein
VGGVHREKGAGAMICSWGDQRGWLREWRPTREVPEVGGTHGEGGGHRREPIISPNTEPYCLSPP